jgi:adenosylcobinamide-GDP ribazoletransferase
VILRLTDLLADLLAAFMLLTRLPFAHLAPLGRSADPAGCIWAFPIVGLVVGCLGGLVYWLAHRLGVPPLPAAVWTLAAMMIATGALHDDGLADTADGFGGGATPARKLEIMRDSHIGSYGALALVLSVVVRAAAIAAVGDPRHVMLVLCLSGMLGRGGILVLLLALRPARDDGMGAAIGEMAALRAAVGLALAIVASLLALPILSAIAIMAAALVASVTVAKLAHAQIGGYTGDVLGAVEVITECVVLTAAATVFGV